MWQLILKADYDYVFEPDVDWLGVWVPNEDKVLINLSGITKKIREGGRTKPKGFERNRPYGEGSKINRVTEKDLTRTIITTLEHESIHVATHEMVENEIKKVAHKVYEDLKQPHPDKPEDYELPSFEDIYRTWKSFHYMVMQEWAIRMIKGVQPATIVRELTEYIKSTDRQGQSLIGEQLTELMMRGDISQMGEGIQLITMHQQSIGKMTEWLMESMLDVQSNIDRDLLGSVKTLGSEDNMPNEVKRRIDFHF